MMPYGWHDGGWGVLWMVLSWTVIVAIVIFIVRAFSQPSTGPSSRERDPLQILDERFARGEISEEEYRERKRVLQDR